MLRPVAMVDRESLVRVMRQRRVQVLLAVVVLLAIVRVALPYVLRSVIVSQADEALIGRIALADLDLSLIRGGVTLHGLEVYAEDAPPRPAEGAAQGQSAPAIFEAKP